MEVSDSLERDVADSILLRVWHPREHTQFPGQVGDSEGPSIPRRHPPLICLRVSYVLGTVPLRQRPRLPSTPRQSRHSLL